jgi:hypothetical protein
MGQQACLVLRRMSRRRIGSCGSIQMVQLVVTTSSLMLKKVKCFDFFLGCSLEVSYLSIWKGALECIELGLAFCERRGECPTNT